MLRAGLKNDYTIAKYYAWGVPVFLLALLHDWTGAAWAWCWARQQRHDVWAEVTYGE